MYLQNVCFTMYVSFNRVNMLEERYSDLLCIIMFI